MLLWRGCVNSLRRLLLVALPALPLYAGAESVITETVHVPLHYRNIDQFQKIEGLRLGNY